MSGEGPVYRPASSGGLDQGTKRLAIIAGGIGVVLLVVVGGWSLGGHHSGGHDSIGGVPVIEPDPGPIKVKPANPGGMQLSGAEPPPANDGNAAGPSLAPGPETPDPAALQAELDAARRAGQPAPVAAAPAPASAVPAAAAPGTALPAQTSVAASPAQSSVAASPAHASNAASSGAAPAAPPLAARTADTAPTPPATAPAPRAPETGGVAVQLAAVDTAAAAHAQWDRLAHEHPGLLDARSPLVIAAQREGKTFYRLRTGGFPTIAAASEFCLHLREAHVACTIATF